MNCARKLASYSSSFCSVKVAIASSRWPNALTSACPVNVSSMWPLSVPVCFHCVMNCGCARLAILRMATPETGTVTSAISASSGEIDEHQRQHADDGQQRGEQLAQRLLQDCWTLSMSLVTRLRISPRGCRSK